MRQRTSASSAKQTTCAIKDDIQKVKELAQLEWTDNEGVTHPLLNDEEVNPSKIQLIEQRYRAARNNALSIVNTPNFAELRDLYYANRKAMHAKYYNMFSSFSR